MKTKENEKLNVTCKMLALAAVVMMMSVAFTACSSDDNDSKPNPDAFEYVDLGLPSGTKWATCNVGAKQPKEYGDYYAWGETKSKEKYDWSTYKWMKEGEADWKHINKYTVKDNQTGADWYKKLRSLYEFIGDNKETLEDVDDVATVKLGKPWRTPTKDELQELISECNWAWINDNDKKGFEIKSRRNNNKIFMPVAGFRKDSEILSAGNVGFYMSKSIDTNNSSKCEYLNLNIVKSFISQESRCFGYLVRPVRK